MKKSYFGIMQPLMFGARKSAPLVDPAPTIDSSAMPDQVLFQTGGLLEVKGAVVTGATSVRWQYSTDGKSWNDLDYGDKVNLSRTANFTESKILRLTAVNGNSDTVYSKTVKASIAYLKIVADLNGNDGPDKVTPIDKWNYQGAAIASTHYYTPRLYVDESGGQRQAGTSWTSSDESLATITGVKSTGQLVSEVKFNSDGVRSVMLTATYQNIKSTLTLK